MSNHVIVEVTVFPLGTGSTSLSNYVAGVEKVLEKYKGIKTMLTPMSTILEGDLGEILAAIREMHESPFLAGAKRVTTKIDIDDRRDKELTMEGKVEAVKSKL
ncbi:MAG TPA: MTH1187 family thiamine-binding protein [Candidatus Deferrimicrobium sp.]|nr:MTH1187 family thiamine-binding protein [Candidatus Deferrimicrobium sp.]